MFQQSCLDTTANIHVSVNVLKYHLSQRHQGRMHAKSKNENIRFVPYMFCIYDLEILSKL